MYSYETLTPFQLKHEFTMVVAGPSKSGTTEFVKNSENLEVSDCVNKLRQ